MMLVGRFLMVPLLFLSNKTYPYSQKIKKWYLIVIYLDMIPHASILMGARYHGKYAPKIRASCEATLYILHM